MFGKRRNRRKQKCTCGLHEDYLFRPIGEALPLVELPPEPFDCSGFHMQPFQSTEIKEECMVYHVRCGLSNMDQTT